MQSEYGFGLVVTMECPDHPLIYQLFVQISKALLVQNHPDAMRFVDSIFSILGDKQIGWDAAKAIGEIGTADKILTKRNHAIIKVHIYCEI